MAIGSRRKRGDDEYIFIDGKAMKAEEAVRIDVSDVAVPGQDATAAQGPVQESGRKRKSSSKDALRSMDQEDAFALRDDAAESMAAMAGLPKLMEDDRRKMRRLYLIFGLVLVVLILASFCVSGSYSWRIYSPGEVLNAFSQWFRLTFIQITDPASYANERVAVMNADVSYADITGHVATVAKYVASGALLSVAGMLYQNTFRNPIAAPSMLGVSNGIQMALLLLVLLFGTQAANMVGLYYLYAYAGGIIILVLVFLGGKWISGKRNFSVVNMILIGTILSQLLGVITTYLQANKLSEQDWLVYYQLQSAANAEGIWTFITLAVGIIVCFVPVILFRFKLNLVSFDDAETRLLGVDPNKLRIMALACGSIMVLTATVNSGQVAMASLVIPFVVRAVFGAEFRKQLIGNVLVGAILILLCGDISNFILIFGTEVDLGSIVTIVAMPLFVWMLAIRQRSWE